MKNNYEIAIKVLKRLSDIYSKKWDVLNATLWEGSYENSDTYYKTLGTLEAYQELLKDLDEKMKLLEGENDNAKKEENRK